MTVFKQFEIKKEKQLSLLTNWNNFINWWWNEIFSSQSSVMKLHLKVLHSANRFHLAKLSCFKYNYSYYIPLIIQEWFDWWEEKTC